MPAIKVYGGGYIERGTSARAIMATTSKEEVARASGLSRNYVRGYWTKTGNKVEIAAAKAKPGMLLVETSPWSGKYREAKRR